MTTANMITLLGIRLEDPSKDLFTDTTLYLMINTAQRKVMQLLNGNALNDFQAVDTNNTNSLDSDLDERYVDISSISPAPFGGVHGIQGIKKNNSDTWYTKISFHQYMDWSNGSVSMSYHNPVYWIRGSKIYISENDSIDVFYTKSPTDVANGTNSDFNEIFHDAILELAEAECWRTAREFDRSGDAESRAMGMISIHNASTPAMDHYSGSVPYDTTGDLVVMQRVTNG